MGCFFTFDDLVTTGKVTLLLLLPGLNNTNPQGAINEIRNF